MKKEWECEKMNKDIMKAMGFGKEVEVVERKECPFYCKKVNTDVG